MSKRKAVHVIIRGRVQGVFFRVETRRTAQRFGITGWVRNRPEGTVEAVFEGETQSVDSILDWCQTGPPMAAVSDVEATPIDYTGNYDGFSIR